MSAEVTKRKGDPKSKVVAPPSFTAAQPRNRFSEPQNFDNNSSDIRDETYWDDNLLEATRNSSREEHNPRRSSRRSSLSSNVQTINSDQTSTSVQVLISGGFWKSQTKGFNQFIPSHMSERKMPAWSLAGDNTRLRVCMGVFGCR